MSNVVLELMATLGIDTTGYEDGLGRAESMGSRIGRGISTMGRVAGVAITAASGAVIGFGKTAIDAGSQFDSSMSQVAATMGTTTDQITELRDFALEMGSTTAFSATQAADALNYMALAGYDADTSMNMLPNVLNLAAAGSIDLARASDMITDAQSALGLSLDETSTMVDQMAMASSKSNTSVEQLGDAILTIGATASNVAGGTTELTTVLGVLADNGIKGAEGGTHLRNMILSLTNPTNEAAGALEALGVQVYDSEGNMRSMIDIIGDLQSSMDGMTQSEIDTYVGQIFNRADMASVNALLNTTIERYDELGGYITEAAGASEQMANTQLDNLSGDVTLFQSALEGARIAVSDALTPALRDFVQLGSDGLSRVTQAFQADGLSGAMTELGTWLSEGLSKIVEMTPDIINAGMQLLGALGKGLMDNAGMITDAAIEVLQLLVDNFLNAVNNGGIEDMINTAMMIVQKLGEFLIENAPALTEATTLLIVQLVELLTEPDNLEMLIEMSLLLIGAIATGLLEAMPELVEAIPVIITNIVTAIANSFPALLHLVDTLIRELFYAVLDLIGFGFNEIQSSGQSNFLTMFGAIGGWMNIIKSLFGEAWSNIVSFITGIWANLNTLAFDGCTGMINVVTNVLSDIQTKFTEIFDGAKAIVSNAIEYIKGLFDFEWSLPDIALPHFNIQGGVAPYGLGGQGTFPSISIDWYAKAMGQPMLLNEASIFGAAGGRLLGGGEAGAEMIYGRDNLMNDIATAVAGVVGSQTIVVQAYFGTEKFDEYVVNSNQRTDFISGGR